MNASEFALDQLFLGNQRFVAGQLNKNTDVKQQRLKLVEGQSPFAIVVGCSDSRVPVEMIFDQGLGDLFVIRVAGNIVNESVAGSVEFAVAKFSCPLIVILGHSHCGAIEATINEINSPSENLSPNLRSIVSAIEPALSTKSDKNSNMSQEKIIEGAVKSNVIDSIDNLYRSSDMIASAFEDGKLDIAGAFYDLESGEVDFLTGYTFAP